MPLSGISRVIAAVAALVALALPVMAQDKSELTRLTEEWLAAPHGDYNSLSFSY